MPFMPLPVTDRCGRGSMLSGCVSMSASGHTSRKVC